MFIGKSRRAYLEITNRVLKIDGNFLTISLDLVEYVMVVIHERKEVLDEK